MHDQISDRAARSQPRTVLVLGGGGAKGYAHAGVLRALAALEIAVDEVIGTGMGSLAGAAFAAGIEPPGIQELLQEFAAAGFFRPESLAQITHGTRAAAVERGARYRALLARWLPADFAALERPFVCSTLSLSRGSMRYLGLPGTTELWSLRDAVHAASCLPGVFEPLEIDGELYVDGGLAEPLPLRVADASRAELIIAVDLSLRDHHAARPRPRTDLPHVLYQTYEILGNVLVEQALHRHGNRPEFVLLQPPLADVDLLADIEVNAIARRGDLEARRTLVSHEITRYLCTPTAVIGADRGIASPRDHVVLEVDQEACIHCGICAATCTTGGYAAVDIGSVVRKLHHYECTRDGACQRSCPTRAIRLNL